MRCPLLRNQHLPDTKSVPGLQSQNIAPGFHTSCAHLDSMGSHRLEPVGKGLDYSTREIKEGNSDVVGRGQGEINQYGTVKSSHQAYDEAAIP
jgi:hypothetical protein